MLSSWHTHKVQPVHEVPQARHRTRCVCGNPVRARSQSLACTAYRSVRLQAPSQLTDAGSSASSTITREVVVSQKTDRFVRGVTKPCELNKVPHHCARAMSGSGSNAVAKRPSGSGGGNRCRSTCFVVQLCARGAAPRRDVPPRSSLRGLPNATRPPPPPITLARVKRDRKNADPARISTFTRENIMPCPVRRCERVLLPATCADDQQSCSKH